MLVRDWVWELIRDSFTEDEKAALRDAMAGETICPRGVVVAEEKLPAELAQKLKGALSVEETP